MKQLRVVDQDGKQRSFLSEFLPRIGERIVVVYGVGNEPVREHHFRVRDVMYRLDDEPENQAAILVSEEENAQPWPSLS